MARRERGGLAAFRRLSTSNLKILGIQRVFGIASSHMIRHLAVIRR
jgi:hypothetical protein